MPSPRRSLALAGDDVHLVALARNATVTATMRARRFDLALPFAEASVQAAERTGRADLFGKALHNLASVVGFLGRHEEADDRRREALPHLEGDLRATAIVHQNLAYGALTFGRPEEAVALAEDAIQVHRDAGAVDHLGIASAVAAVALATLDRAAEGLAVIEAAEALLDGDERGLCQLGSLRAALLALAGRSADGRRTWAALRFLPESLGLDPATAEALVGAWTGGSAAPELGPRLLADPFTVRWLHGQLLGLRATGRCRWPTSR